MIFYKSTIVLLYHNTNTKTQNIQHSVIAPVARTNYWKPELTTKSQLTTFSSQ